jgi:gamma-glutamyltranspeptidase/glutathione hydrolase
LFVHAAFAASPEAVHGQHGMVASRSMLASEVGAQIMRDGGNAIDAAVATGFALAVTYPSAGNLGGGGFMVIRLADGTVVTNDNRERAPGAAHRDMYLDKDGNFIKGLPTAARIAAAVPGTVAGLLDVLERYGTLSRKQVVAPAIALARKGFPLSYDLARQFARRAELFRRYPASAAVFLRPDGTPFAAGDSWRQPDLARSLERISRHGRDGFYKGKTADLIVAEMQRGNGLISHADLATYESIWREPVHGRYRGYDIYGMSPPSSGGVLIMQMLNMLEPYDLKSMGFGSAVRAHLLIEVERRAYADRAQHLGDPDYYPVPIERLVDPAYALARFADFNPERASRSVDIGAGTWPDESPDTTHVSVMDAAGNAVAFTTTLNHMYGSKIVVDGGGFLLNNEMDDFSVKENVQNTYELTGGDANAIAPGKRMLSSLAPTIVVKDGQSILVTGSPGGSMIITTVLQVIVNIIDHGMDVSDAVAAPRFHHQWKPDRIVYEPDAFSPDTRRVLERLGHGEMLAWDLLPWSGSMRAIGGAHSVMWRDGELLGMSDPRKDGGAAGL